MNLNQFQLLKIGDLVDYSWARQQQLPKKAKELPIEKQVGEVLAKKDSLVFVSMPGGKSAKQELQLKNSKNTGVWLGYSALSLLKNNSVNFICKLCGAECLSSDDNICIKCC